MRVTLRVLDVSGLNARAPIPFRFSVLVGPLLSFNTAPFAGVASGAVTNFGMELSGDSLDLRMQSLTARSSSDQTDLRTDVRMAVYNSANPLQFFWPTANDGHGFGDLSEFLLASDYYSAFESGPRLPPQGSALAKQPTDNGNAYANPLLGSSSLFSTLYLLTLYPTQSSRPQTSGIPAVQANGGKQDFQLHYLQVLLTPNYATSSGGFGVSMFGIVGVSGEGMGSFSEGCLALCSEAVYWLI